MCLFVYIDRQGQMIVMQLYSKLLPSRYICWAVVAVFSVQQEKVHSAVLSTTSANITLTLVMWRAERERMISLNRFDGI